MRILPRLFFRPRDTGVQRRSAYVPLGLMSLPFLTFCLALPGESWGGEKDPRQPEKPRRDWTRKGPIRESSLPAYEPQRATRSHIKVGEVTAIVGEVKVTRENPDGKARVISVQKGDHIYVGDQIGVGATAAAELEMTLGLNARVRIGSNSIMKVKGIISRPRRKKVVATRRELELTQGSARVRVKKNTLTPSTVLLISGNVTIIFDRSDAVVKRANSESTLMVLKGEAELVLNDPDNRRGGVRTIRVGKKEKITVPDNVRGELPRPEKMDPDEVEKTKRGFSFSIERERKKIPPRHKQDAELSGP